MDRTLSRRLEDLRRISTNLRDIDAHDALIITKISLSTPRLLYTLRCSPCFKHNTLIEIDSVLRSNLNYLANINMTDLQWIQASLPTKVGGLGIRSASALTLPAFLASSAGTKSLQDLILLNCVVKPDPFVNIYLEEWMLSYANQPRSGQPSSGEQAGKQCNWDKPIIDSDLQYLLRAQPDQLNQARLLAVSSPHSSDWLNALPLSSCGLRLNKNEIHVAIGLRLGSSLCEPHDCPCGNLVDSSGLHGLSCKHNAARFSRHHCINDVIWRALLRANIPASKEPSGLSRLDGKRPDGMTLIPWEQGKSAIWDVTVAHTLADSYLSLTSVQSGSAAELASARKISKYSELAKNYSFIPIAVETLGPFCQEGRNFLEDVGKRLSMTSGDPRETSFLFQRLSVTVQRFNAICFFNSFPPN